MITHGTANGYIYYGCRCDLCKTAATERMRAYRATPKGNAVMRENGKKARRIERECVNYVRTNLPDIFASIQNGTKE